MKTDLLIIFYRNPELGKVKTRLAATVGDEKAFAIYLKLASHTREVALQTACDRVVYYSDFIDTEDSWSNDQFKKSLQTGESLGERMKQAFANSFDAGYKRVCIIGTDCPGLTTQIINESFVKLKSNDVVIGPATDGGYYLLGMENFWPALFENKAWSTDSVLSRTVQDAKQLNLLNFLLPTLTDVDEEKDLPTQY
ncbi:MAG: TIGR04282 family arsenosugar biosynthesis glycosyltransferase [Flammeovirgaceae bacterium]|nr:TIGR04282 family arsenosugar biosynthesis glycosyltransferase [Flammeovirgaceae bacterium]